MQMLAKLGRILFDVGVISCSIMLSLQGKLFEGLAIILLWAIYTELEHHRSIVICLEKGK